MLIFFSAMGHLQEQIFGIFFGRWLKFPNSHIYVSLDSCYFYNFILSSLAPQNCHSSPQLSCWKYCFYYPCLTPRPTFTAEFFYLLKPIILQKTCIHPFFIVKKEYEKDLLMNFELRQNKKNRILSQSNSLIESLTKRLFAFSFIAWLSTIHKGILPIK